MERPTKMTPRLILIMLKHHPMCYVIECTMNLNRCDKATAEAWSPGRSFRPERFTEALHETRLRADDFGWPRRLGVVPGTGCGFYRVAG